eukprot:TRINITY_DN231_c0_g2_i2.p1 TRINITY_DN231_c0_g2~~TRINITY_DN231_c0_g2_i2.p1  ORF type:complete len:297 (+),score=43.32 TRINITY_DN231_c0_g2_i2:107-997(+)
MKFLESQQRKIFLAITIAWVCITLNRYCFTHAAPFLLLDPNLELKLTDIGLMNTVFVSVYGVTKVLAGFIADKNSPRNLLVGTVLSTSILNLAFAYRMGNLMFLWVLNGFVQGFGWPACSLLLREWCSGPTLGAYWSGVSLAQTVSMSFSAGVGGYITTTYGWQTSFIWPSIVGIIAIAAILLWIKDPVTEERSIAGSTSAFVSDILLNKSVWLWSLSDMLSRVVLTGFQELGILYLAENIQFSLLEATNANFYFAVGGVAGTFLIGFASDIIFHGERELVTLLYSVGVFLLGDLG